MDQWLAQIYGTNGGGEDLEKTAQNMLLQKLAEEEGVDLSGLDEEQLQALAAEVLGDDQAQGEPTPEEIAAYQEQEMAKEAQAKFEEADFLGRVMAHSYTQELEKIATVRESLGRAAEKVEHVGRKVTDTIGRGGAAAGKGIGRAAKWTAGHVASGAKATGRHLMKHRGKYGLGAGAAGLAAGAEATRRHFKKEASAFEKLAEMRAAEILQANGVDPSTGAPAEAQDPNEQFSGALDQRAVEILAENGYDVSGLQ